MSYLEAAKQELAALRDQDSRAASPLSGPDRIDDQAPTPEKVAEMRLDDFAAAGLVVEVHSTVLDCAVLFVSDDVPADDPLLRDRDLPVYRAAELRKLAILRPRPQSCDLRHIHDVKTIFDGAINDVRTRDDHAQET